MRYDLTWADLNEVVHAVVEGVRDGYTPPHGLVLLCQRDVTWLTGRPGTFGYIMSCEIRMAARYDVLTCLACVACCTRG